MNAELVRYSVSDRIAEIMLDRPPVNALSMPLIDALLAALQKAKDDPAVSAVIIGSLHKVFCAGLDLSELSERDIAAGIAHSRAWHRAFERIEFGRAPVVAVLHGAVVGGGLELALACRRRAPTEHPKTRLGLPEVQLGLIPGLGGTQRLPRFVGKSKAMDMVLTGRMMDAAEAERCGLVSRVVPLAQLMDDALATAEKIAGMSLLATMVAKEAVNRAFETTLAEGVRFERRTFHATFAFEDRAEGMAAFADKRKAAWKHR